MCCFVRTYSNNNLVKLRKEQGERAKLFKQNGIVQFHAAEIPSELFNKKD